MRLPGERPALPICITVSKVHELLIESGHVGTASRSVPVWSQTSGLVVHDITTNKLPQVADQKFTYVGELAADKWISLVSYELNNKNPCLRASDAAASPSVGGTTDARLHSGAVLATSGTKDVVIPQASGNLLDPSKTFAVCYAETDGSTSDSTWRDTFIRLKITKIETIVAYTLTHRTTGQIPNHATLKVTYVAGTGEQSF